MKKTISICVLFFGLYSNVFSQKNLILDSSSATISIEKEHIMVFDTNTFLDANEVYKNRNTLFSKTQATPVYSANFNSHWVIFNLEANTTGSYVLDYQQVFIDEVDFYLFLNDSLILVSNSGYLVPFAAKPVKSRYQAVNINVNQGNLYTVLIQSRNIKQYFSSRFFLELTDSQSFQLQNDANLIQLSLISGCLLFVGFFALGLFLYSKESIYAFYAFYVLLITSYFASSHGIFTQFFHINSFLASSRMHTFSSVIGFAFHVLYLGKFFKIYHYDSKVFYNTHLIMVIIFVSHVMFVCFRGYSPIPDFLIHSLFGLLVIAFIIIGTLKKQKEAYLYLLASGPVLFFYLVITLGNLKLIPISKGIFYNFNIPILLEALGLGAGLLYLFIMERRKLQTELLESKTQVVQQIILAQENERASIASDLHDDLGGTLSFLQREFNDLNIKLNGQYNIICELIEKAVQDLRLISHRMLPVFFEGNGFNKALNYDINLINSQEDIKVSIILDGVEKRFEKEKELNCYRIVKELLNNALKHSKATLVIIQVLYLKDLLYISVEDNGVGINSDKLKNGIGLNNINLRCEFLKTKLNIDSSSKGTIMSLEIPY